MFVQFFKKTHLDLGSQNPGRTFIVVGQPRTSLWALIAMSAVYGGPSYFGPYVHI
jgi:hypothetical protein